TKQYAVGQAEVNLETGEYTPSVMDICYDMSFPPEAVKLFADKTNAYVKHCTTDPPPGQADTRKEHQ
ncbi:unnamed protein product, partial [Ectocarpus sp. 12 AP-2014]